MAPSFDFTSFSTAAWEQVSAAPQVAGVVVGVLSLTIFAFATANRNNNHAPALADPIPFFWNAYQYMTDQVGFLARVRKALLRHRLVSFYVGPIKFYMVKNSQSIQAMFRTSTSLSPNRFMFMVFENIMNFTKDDLAKFKADGSGRLATPLTGYENTPAIKRYWAAYHRIMHDYLARAHEANALSGIYQRLFSKRFDQFPVGEWTTVCIKDFLETDMFTAALETFCGPRMLEINPDLKKTFWEFVDIAASLVYGLPRWMNPKAIIAREKMIKACGKYLDACFADFDWNSPDAESDWDPIWGSRANRELCKFFRDAGLTEQAQAGILSTTSIFGANSNSIPITAWMVMEVARDPELFRALREETNTAVVTDPVTKERSIDRAKMLALPLLQAVYAEALRMHMSIHITREVMEPVQVEGYTLEPGAILQGPCDIIHFDEAIWGGAGGRPASEFWPYRHIKYVEEKDGDGKMVKKVPQFSMTGRSTEFVPYGGGISMCPGRHFAKQEMMLTTAMLVSRFDMEFVEWTKLDGSPSDRPAQNYAKFVGGAAVPPDREMKVRWKKLW